MDMSRWDKATEKTLRVLIENYLDLSLLSNAIFLAERLYALASTQKNLHLLSTCLVRDGKFHRAYIILQRDLPTLEFGHGGPDDEASRSSNSPCSSVSMNQSPLLRSSKRKIDRETDYFTQNRYLFAQCCFELGKLREAEAVLVRGTKLATDGPQKCIEEILSADGRNVPNQAAGLYMLGMICLRDKRREHATTYFALTLCLDPFFWDAFNQLCSLGVEIAPECFFGNPFESNYFKLDGDSISVDRGTAEKFLSQVCGKSEGDRTYSNSLYPTRRNANSQKQNVNIATTCVPVPIRSGRMGSESGARLLKYVSGLRIGLSKSSEYSDIFDKKSGSDDMLKKDSTMESIAKGSCFLPTGFTSSYSDTGWQKPAAAKAEVGVEIVINASQYPEILQCCDLFLSSSHSGESSLPLDSERSDPLGRIAGNSRAKSSLANDESDRRGRRLPARNTRGARRTTSAIRFGESVSKVGESPSEAENNHSSPNENASDDLSNIDKDISIGNKSQDLGFSETPYRFFGSYGSNFEKDSLSLDDLVGSMLTLSLLCKLGRGVQSLSEYNCSDALEAFDNLPLCQQRTGWVAHQRGKAKFEMGDYQGAKDEFETMKDIAPDRISGLDLYSTNLWHLKKEVELCYLAQHTLSLDKCSPEAWICIGNSFSLQKEHDLAIKFFQRGLQIDPNFTYAYTLCGHEYVSNEDFEKAIVSYRHAIRTDSRHYNAWYGLATIYHRQEKFELAEYHFRRAITINPRSSVLYCYLGTVLHARHKYEDALDALQRASDLEPVNPQAKFQRALVLKTMSCYEAALEELKAVRDFAPSESSVHFLMGKIYKQLGNIEKAMMHFTTALDLDPKGSNPIKLAIDKLDQYDGDEDVDEL